MNCLASSPALASDALELCMSTEGKNAHSSHAEDGVGRKKGRKTERDGELVMSGRQTLQSVRARKAHSRRDLAEEMVDLLRWKRRTNSGKRAQKLSQDERVLATPVA
mmetsp:Transcript_49058/g.113379  ORF Transcript_49058/g.113379 Transcript_49058/m.113379 type:complete len:107 (-) Transcript_49058:78-398(-)